MLVELHYPILNSIKQAVYAKFGFMKSSFFKQNVLKKDLFLLCRENTLNRRILSTFKFSLYENFI